MEQTVYGDVLFFVNFCMDFQCLFLTAKLMRRPCHVWRTVLASALGALYACAALFFSVSGAVAFLADCGVCLGMCAISFLGEGGGLRRVGLSFLIYFGVSFAVGGVMSGMASLLSRAELPLGGGSGLSSVGFFLLAVLGGTVTFLWGRFCQRRAKGQRARLQLTFAGRSLAVDCLVDTGNLLRDPVSGVPVALLELRAAEGVLPLALLEVVRAGRYDGLASLERELARRVRLIPAGTATGRGMLFAVAPDRAVVDAGRGERLVELLVAPVPLAVDADDYRALLPAELIVE